MEGASLVMAWLRDHTPPVMAQRVHLLPSGKPATQEPAQTFPEGMSQELRERLMFFGQLAMANPDVRQIIDVCYEAAKRSTQLPPSKPLPPLPKKERGEDEPAKIS